METINSVRAVFIQPPSNCMWHMLAGQKDCFCYEWSLDSPTIYVPDGRLHIIYNMDKREYISLVYCDRPVKWEITGDRMFGICIGNSYQAEYDEKTMGEWMGGLKCQSSFERRIQYLDKGLKEVCLCRPVHPLLSRAVEKIIAAKGKMAVEDVAEELQYTPRHLQRMFYQVYSYGPKRFNQYIRVNSALSLMEQFPDRRFLEIAEQTGYSDQSHFQREFKRFTGMTPKQFAVKYIKREIT